MPEMWRYSLSPNGKEVSTPESLGSEYLPDGLVVAVTALTDQMVEIAARLQWLEERPSQPHPDPAAEGSEDEDPTDATPRSLLQDNSLQNKVHARLADLHVAMDDSDSDDPESQRPTARNSAGKHPKRLGRAKTADDIIIHEIDWPHFYIFRGPDRRPAKYEDLSLAEFVSGYLSMVIEGRESRATKDRMLTHLRELMQDACDYNWVSLRNYHTILMSHFEMDRIYWGNMEAIQQLRQSYAQKYLQGAPVATRVDGRNDISGRSWSGGNNMTYCMPYQQGACQLGEDHKPPRGFLARHICAFCIHETGRPYRHQEKECRRKAALADTREKNSSMEH